VRGSSSEYVENSLNLSKAEKSADGVGWGEVAQ